MSINVYKVCIPAIVFSILLCGCQNVSGSTESTNEIQNLKDEISELRLQITTLQNSLDNVNTILETTINSCTTLKVNDLYNKGQLENVLLELNQKSTLTSDELEFQVKALAKIDWNAFYIKSIDLDSTSKYKSVTFKFLEDYSYYTKSDLLAVLRAYKNSDGLYSINFAWTLYDLHNKFSTESEFLYENNEDYRNTIDSFTDENGDVIIP